MVKAAAAHFGFNPDAYASHSLRIGLATAMATLPAPFCEDSFIKDYGGWSSDAFRVYIHRAVEDLAAVAELVAGTNVHVVRRSGH